MDRRKRTYTNESSAQEAAAVLDPLIQPFDDQTSNPVYFKRPSSVFFIPANQTNENPRSNCLKKCFSFFERFSGIFYSLIASLLFTCTNFMIKKLNVVVLDVFLVRFVIQGIISFIFIICKGYSLFSFNSHGLLIFIRSIISATGSVCFYIALALLPLPDVTTLRYTQVVWTALLVLIIFRERINLPIILASLLTLIGVVCVAQPSFIFTKVESFNATTQTSTTTPNQYRILGMSIALLCAFSISMGFVLTKKLLEKKVRQSILMLYFILSALILLIIVQIYYWKYSPSNERKFDIKEVYLTKKFFYATSLATLQLIPMILSQKSIKREHPSIVTVVQASDILFAIIFQTLFSNEESNTLALIGSLLVIASIVIVGAHKLWQDRRNRICDPEPTEENK